MAGYTGRYQSIDSKSHKSTLAFSMSPLSLVHKWGGGGGEEEEAPLNEVNNIDFSENYARLSKHWTGLVTFACRPLSMGSE